MLRTYFVKTVDKAFAIGMAIAKCQSEQIAKIKTKFNIRINAL